MDHRVLDCFWLLAGLEETKALFVLVARAGESAAEVAEPQVQLAARVFLWAGVRKVGVAAAEVVGLGMEVPAVAGREVEDFMALAVLVEHRKVGRAEEVMAWEQTA